MSNGWNNVIGVTTCELYVGGKMNGDAAIFLNGLHQIPLDLTLKFSLVDATQPGPTTEEINSSITWVRNDDGGSLARLLVNNNRGQYCVFYTNTSAFSENPEPLSSTEPLHYAVEANNSATALESESLSLIIHAITDTGRQITYDASDAKGTSDLHTHVNFVFLPEKIYGTGASAATGITVHSAPDADCTVNEPADADNQLAAISFIQIDDALFYIHDFTWSKPITYIGLSYIHKEPQSAIKNRWWNTFIDNEYSIIINNTQNQIYSRNIFISYDSATASGEILNLIITARFPTQPFRIYYVAFRVDVTHWTDEYSIYVPTYSITTHDQFGNRAIISMLGNTLPTILDVS